MRSFGGVGIYNPCAAFVVLMGTPNGGREVCPQGQVPLRQGERTPIKNKGENAMQKTLSFALALVLCLGLTLPACAAEKTDGPTGTAGSSTVSDTKGNTYTLSNSILYKIDRATPPFNSFEGQSMFSDENEIDAIYAVPAGTIVTAPNGIMFPVDESWDVVWNDGTPSLMIYGTGGEGFSSYEMSDANVLWVFPCHLTAFTGDNFSMEGHTGTIAFYTPDGEHAAANPFISATPSTSDQPTTTETPNKTSFTDVAANAYYADAVTWAVAENITSGTSATTFSPNENCTVGQILTFLWRANGSPEPTIKNPYSNIKESDYYYKALLWATELDLIASDEGIFNANLPCTRIMAVFFMWKATNPTYDSASGETQLFTDVPIEGFGYQAVYWAVQKGITSGTSTTTFSPDQTCTRGQIVTFLHRAYAK